MRIKVKEARGAKHYALVYNGVTYHSQAVSIVSLDAKSGPEAMVESSRLLEKREPASGFVALLELPKRLDVEDLRLDAASLNGTLTANYRLLYATAEMPFHSYSMGGDYDPKPLADPKNWKVR